MLKFAKGAPYIPDPARSRPYISENEKELAQLPVPFAMPGHCKPWLDGQTIGWTLFYGFLTPITIHGLDDGTIRVENGEALSRETGQPLVTHQFATGYFGLGTGYTLQSPPGLVSLFIPATHSPAGLELITGVVETDWYPRQLFLVFRIPSSKQPIHLDHKMELARVVLVPRPELLEALPMTDKERNELSDRESAYLAEERVTPSRWVAADGANFTHLYKIWSKRCRQGEPTSSA